MHDTSNQRRSNLSTKEIANAWLHSHTQTRRKRLYLNTLSHPDNENFGLGGDNCGNTYATENPWMPIINKGFNLLPIKRVARLFSGYAFSSDDLGDDGIPVIRIGDVGFNINPDGAKKFTGVVSASLDQFRIKKYDILIAMTGATIGKFGVYRSDDEAFLNQRVGAFRVFDIDHAFFTAFLDTRIFREQMKLYAYGGAQPNIGSSEIGSIILPLPPREIQKELGRQIEHNRQRLGELEGAILTSVERLQEFRFALITAAVTGQIDIAAWGKRGMADRRLDDIEAEMAAAAPEREKERA